MAAKTAELIPSTLAQAPRYDGAPRASAAEMTTTKSPCIRHTAATPMAVRQVGCSISVSTSDPSSSMSRSASSRRKKTKKSTRLF